nr:PREDICTED: titin homolog isoform X2 [Daucus carota subsp. sativus]
MHLWITFFLSSDSYLVPKNKRHGSSIDEEEKPAQGNPIKSFRKKLRSSLVHQKQDTGRSNAINLVPPKEAGPSEPTDSDLVPKNKRHGSSIDEEEKPAQGNPIKSFRKKLRSSLVHQKQDTGRSNAINLVPPKEAGPSEPTDSYLVPKNKRHGSSIDEEEKPAQGNPIKSFRKKLRSSLVHQKQDTGRSNAINLVPPKEAGPSEPTDSDLVPKNKRHGSSIDEEEKPAQGNPIKSFRKKLRSSLVHQKQDTGRSNAINLVPPKEAGPSEPTDSYLVPRHKRHGSSIDEEEKPAQGNPIKSFRKKLRSSLVHQKQDTGRSNAINLVPPKDAAASEPTDSDLVPKNKRHGSSIDEEEKPAQRYPIKSFPKKLRSSLVHQKQDTGRSNAINLVPPKEAAASEPTGRFTPREYSNRVEIFCGISMRTFRDLCTLVKEPLSNSPRYKFNDNRELTVDAKVAIAMRRLKLGKSLNSIGDETGMHSFTADKVTRSFVEAVNGLSHLHGPGAATEGGTSAETLDSAVEEGMSVEKLDRLKEEWKVLTTGMKPEKLRCMIKACCILHNIVTDMND